MPKVLYHDIHEYSYSKRLEKSRIFGPLNKAIGTHFWVQFLSGVTWTDLRYVGGLGTPFDGLALNGLSSFPGAVYLEGGLDEARLLFGRLLFNSEVSGWPSLWYCGRKWTVTWMRAGTLREEPEHGFSAAVSGTPAIVWVWSAGMTNR